MRHLLNLEVCAFGCNKIGFASVKQKTLKFYVFFMEELFKKELG